jgi:L-fucose mutarotase
MLRGIDPVLTPDVLHALCSMGHGDELVVVDAHYPADTAARSSTVGRLLRLDGIDTARALRALLSVFVLDILAERPAERMLVDDQPEALPNVQKEAQTEVERALRRPQPFAGIPRAQFYERAKKAYCVIITGEIRGWGCFIFKKGVEVAPDAPRQESATSTGERGD